MSGAQGTVLRLPDDRIAPRKVRQRARLGVLELQGRVPDNVVRLHAKSHPPKHVAKRPAFPFDEPSFVLWQSIYSVLSPAQKDDAARLLRVLSGGNVGFGPAD
jgi:hypothetical protein